MARCHFLLTLFGFFLPTVFGSKVLSGSAFDCIHNEGKIIKVRLIDDDSYPYVEAKCSGNGYLIIDINRDENWLNYFSSHRLFHHNVLGPERDDIVNWDEWFLPSMNKYIVSPDCNTCNEEEILNENYGTQSGYYMMSVMDGCTQLPIGRIGCDMDYNTYECRVCGTKNRRPDGYWVNMPVYNGLNMDKVEDGTAIILDEIEDHEHYRYGLCGFTIRDAMAPHSKKLDTFEHCKTVTHEDTDEEGENIIPRRKPSLGTGGNFCVCAKPHTSDFYKVFDYDETTVIEDKQPQTEEEEEQEQENNEEEEEEETGEEGIVEDNLPVIELYQSDFKTGTYRIFQPGKYVIMEDITFDFNAPEGYENGGLDTYNGEGMWWPNENDKIDNTDEQKYPGAGSLKDAYFMGFYAGIAIESTDTQGVIIDLNGHTLQMSKAFFYQQTFFALIALSGQTFLPGQGPGFFGANPTMAKHVEIRNGKLGLSSHHGIQGNFNEDVYIHDLEITDFKTHGIQLNGFKDVIIENIEVHDNRVEDKLSPFVAHMRHYLPIHRMMAEDLKEQGKDTICINFNNRMNNDAITPVYSTKSNNCVTYSDMIENMEILLDMAFEFAVFDKKEDELLQDKTTKVQELWNLNKDMIINSNRNYNTWTATVYGIFLNYVGSNVIGWYAGGDHVKSRGIKMDNINIHNLYHDTQENVAFSQGWAAGEQRILNCLNAPFNAYHIFGEKQVNKISICNMYGNEHPDYDENTCDQDNFEKSLQYQGNIVTDIHLATYYLINEHRMSWNYCSGGAADLNALVEFAMEGTPFYSGTPKLAVSHDPMIHPGKGVLGLRLNGVDQAELSRIKIDNIVSDTRLGTLIANKYDFVVSQQKPYMKGFSMNMVNGLTVTMCDEMSLDDISISNIKSATGLAYGLAVWFQTSLTMKTGVTISNVMAGHKLKQDEGFIDSILKQHDYLPNVKPESCPFRLYDDNNRQITLLNNNDKTELITDLLNINCVQGYTTCNFDVNAWNELGLTSYYKMDNVYTPCNENSELGGKLDIINIVDKMEKEEARSSSSSSWRFGQPGQSASIPEENTEIVKRDNKRRMRQWKLKYEQNKNKNMDDDEDEDEDEDEEYNVMMNVELANEISNHKEKSWVKYVVASAAILCVLGSLTMVWKEMQKQERKKSGINSGNVESFGSIGVIGFSNNNNNEDKALLDGLNADERYVAV